MIPKNTTAIASYEDLVRICFNGDSPTIKVRDKMVEVWNLSESGSAERDLITNIVSRYERMKLGASNAQLKLLNSHLMRLKDTK